MSFEIDSQTLEDLNLLGKFKTNSIFSIFNKTVTRRGELLLERAFLNPYTNAEKINEQSAILSLFVQEQILFPFSREQMQGVEHYLEGSDYKNILLSVAYSAKRKIMQLVANDREWELLQEGFDCSIAFIRVCRDHFSLLQANSAAVESGYVAKIKSALSILLDKKLEWIYSAAGSSELSFASFAMYDHKMRFSLSDMLHQLLEIIYEMDMLVAVSTVGRERGFGFASAREGKDSFVELHNVRHPAVENAVGNNLTIGNGANVLFLTGANMAGKSTLMKSFGVSLYLAHMGFPVPADKMDFTVFQGLYTSINVPDNLSMGYSHFYAEVVRVKKIAIAAASGKKFAIIFDELFKGTNVKDAYDATVAITDSFSKIKESIFIVSTHIMEAGVTLRERSNCMQFWYLPTLLEGSVPRYTYTLQQGISDERHGMIIVNNEKIIEIINSNA